MKQVEKRKIQVVLLEEVPKLGNAGDNKDVAPGFARNYLFPRNLATLATPSAIRFAEERRNKENKRQQKTRAAQEEVAKKLEGLNLKITAKAGTKGRLFGSITAVVISEKLKESSGYNIDRRKIILPDSIRNVGAYDIKVRIAPDLMPTLKVEIAAVEPPETASSKQ